ncbi:MULTISPECIES: hypothetical protein [Agrobacterium]|uniref:Uncharacterized protein n=1 Tax=Agrobacterium tumefaciens TaxID=358 RepID=A0A4D7YT81_AGRTU|nr:hypothetical protein [Agrobacterium tumefaciens]QCL96736.1 hypothetical protein CFBP7129_21425 [Agrobacterium tumefaciens]
MSNPGFSGHLDMWDINFAVISAVVVYEYSLMEPVTGFNLRSGETSFAIATASPKTEAYKKHGAARGRM